MLALPSFFKFKSSIEFFQYFVSSLKNQKLEFSWSLGWTERVEEGFATKLLIKPIEHLQKNISSRNTIHL